MSERFTVAMFTDHDYYGFPVECSRVEVAMADTMDWTPEMIAYVRQQAQDKLHNMTKRMPHSYWRGRAHS